MRTGKAFKKAGNKLPGRSDDEDRDREGALWIKVTHHAGLLRGMTRGLSPIYFPGPACHLESHHPVSPSGEARKQGFVLPTAAHVAEKLRSLAGAGRDGAPRSPVWIGVECGDSRLETGPCEAPEPSQNREEISSRRLPNSRQQVARGAAGTLQGVAGNSRGGAGTRRSGEGT